MISNCTRCDATSGYTTCLGCEAGLYPSVENDKCLKCEYASPNCITCDVDYAAGKTVCSQCYAGYLLLFGSCEKCTSPCSACVDTLTKCTECI